jgi:hypothetical protein
MMASVSPKDVRTLGRALDALVRTARTHGAAVETAAWRLRDAWLAVERAPIRFGPTELYVRDDVALGGSDEEVRWLLPIFMAGLRQIAPRDSVTVYELCQLAEELARCEPEVSSLERFRDWLWGGGAAAGFEVELQTSFMEAVEAELPEAVVAPDGFLEGGLTAARLPGVQTLEAGSIELAALDLDAVSTREEFDASLDAAVEDEPPVMHEARRVALRYLCEAPGRWSLCEATAIVAIPALQVDCSPEALARQLADALRENLDVDVIDLLASSVRRNDPFARAVLRGLDYPGLPAAAIGAFARADDGHRVLGNLLAAVSPELASRVAHALLDGASSETALFDIALRIVTSLGAVRFIGLLDVPALRPPEAHSLGALFAERDDVVELLAPLVPQVPRPALPRLLEALPPEVRPRLAPALGARWAELSGGFVETQLAPLFIGAGAEGVRTLAEALVAQHGEGWSVESVRMLGRALVRARLFTDICMPLVRSKRIPVPVRIALCDAAEADPEVAAAVSRWHPGELLDPPELRARLRSLRELEAARR